MITIVEGDSLIQILVAWVIILVFTLSFGLIIETFICTEKEYSILMLITLGLIGCTVYTQIYSLFLGVKSCNALAILVGVIAVCVLWKRKSIAGSLRILKSENEEFYINDRKKVLLCVFFWIVTAVIICIYSSSQPEVPDTYLYHGQAVRWIEEFGSVKGSALINGRIGFNNSCFALFALFGFRDVFGYTVHAVNGYILLIVMCYLTKQAVFKTSIINVLLVTAGWMYIHLYRFWISSLTPDLFSNAMAFIIVILWVEANKDKTPATDKLAEISILTVFLTTIKLSFAFMCILMFLPIVQYVIQKEYRKIAYYFIIGLVLSVPFIIRNYFISGWLLFPISGIDVFDVVWKVPKDELINQANAAYGWARMPNENYANYINVSIIKWVPVWWRVVANTKTKMFVLANAIAIFYQIFVMVVDYWNKKLNVNNTMLVIAIVANEIYWFLTAPDIRFICILLILLPLLSIAQNRLCIKIIENILKYKYVGKYILAILFCMISLYELKSVIQKVDFAFDFQRAYKYYECDYVSLENGTKVYYSEDGMPGCDVFPGTVGKVGNIGCLGENIKDGFYYKTIR